MPRRETVAEKRTQGVEKRQSSAEKRKSGAEMRKSGAERRNCILGPLYVHSIFLFQEVPARVVVLPQ